MNHRILPLTRLILLICISQSTVNSLECYECGPSETNCKQGRCISDKCGSATGTWNGKKMIQKLCFHSSEEPDGCKSFGQLMAKSVPASIMSAAENVCLCSKDYCNGSNGISRISALILIVLGFAVSFVISF